MKLNIDFEQDPRLFGRPKAIITDDRGERLPGVRNVNINYKYQDATIVTLTLVVNGRDVLLGREKPRKNGYFDCVGRIE